MRLAVLVLAGCAAAPWRPTVWNEPPTDPAAQPVVFAFPDGANGTALVIAMLAQAKTAEVSGLSRFALEVGGCTREIAVTPRSGPRATGRALDRITVRVRETTVACRRFVDQELVPAAQGSDGDPPKKFRDATMVAREVCDETPIEHVVTRYRFEVDHQVATPDWDEVARYAGVRLAFATPQCAADRATTNEIRAVFNHAHAPAPIAPPPPARSTARATIIDLATRAASASDPETATRFAEQAISALDGVDAPDDALAERIAAAYYYAVAADADRYLHRTPPSTPELATEEWARELGVELDRFARRYERIGDVVRLPVATRWLHAGALRLADLLDHTATLLDAAQQPKAAEAERAKARALREAR